MKKLLCVLLCLLLPLSALGAARMPERRGNINDTADILSARTVTDLGEFAKQLSQRCQVDLHVATVHFLDGLDAQTYSAQLFEKWELDETDLLLVGAAGEDAFAAVMGAEAEKTLGRTNAENLLYTSSDFGALFRAQQYDAAMKAYAQSLNALLNKQTGSGVRMDGLFGEVKASEPFVLNGGELWRQVKEAINEIPIDEWEDEEKENGLSAGGWIILIAVLGIMTQRDKRKYKRRSPKGCSPLGWLIGLLGLSFLFGKD